MRLPWKLKIKLLYKKLKVQKLFRKLTNQMGITINEDKNHTKFRICKQATKSLQMMFRQVVLTNIDLFACLSSSGGQEGGNLQLHNVINGSVLRKQQGVMIC